jgi:hypothetical protein
VTVQTPTGHIRYDLVGRSHGGIPTPHATVYRIHRNPCDPTKVSKAKELTREVTSEELDDLLKRYGG